MARLSSECTPHDIFENILPREVLPGEALGRSRQGVNDMIMASYYCIRPCM